MDSPTFAKPAASLSPGESTFLRRLYRSVNSLTVP